MQQMAALRELESTLSNEMQNITPFPRAPAHAAKTPVEHETLKDAGDKALALANMLSRVIAENEARACDLVQRALDELAAAKAETEELQARAARAEKRAEKAESYLVLVEDALEKVFARRERAGRSRNKLVPTPSGE
jgi:hypothetical protein